MAATSASYSKSDNDDDELAKFDRNQLSMKCLLEFFMKTEDRDLLAHRKCISSTVNFISCRTVHDSMYSLQPVMLMEKEKQAIVVFKKESKKTTDDV